jgi:glycine/serine hydroxymethyltransferase
VQRNAKAWAKALKEVGLEVEGDPTEGYTETHQVVIRVSQYGTGLGVARRLEDSNIICNFQALPDDSDFLTASGLRTGVSEMTRFGMNEADFGPLAELFAECVIQKRDVSAEASHYRQQFQTMRFCLPAQGAAEMGARLVASTFPASAYAEALADAMYSLAQNSGGDA